MPNENSVVMRVSQPVKRSGERRVSPPQVLAGPGAISNPQFRRTGNERRQPMTIEEARQQGFTDVSFHPSVREAAEWAERLEDMTGRKTVTFDEYCWVGGKSYVLHVVAETPRPKPVITTEPAIKFYDPATRAKQREQFWAAANKQTCPPRAMDNTPLHITFSRAAKRHENENAKLNAFAIFMGEWAAKLRKVVSR
jgi:hypothetical protein